MLTRSKSSEENLLFIPEIDRECRSIRKHKRSVENLEIVEMAETPEQRDERVRNETRTLVEAEFEERRRAELARGCLEHITPSFNERMRIAQRDIPAHLTYKSGYWNGKSNAG